MHVFQAAYIHQIYNQFQFMEAFEVGAFRLITCFHQSFKSCLYQCTDSAAQDCLFAKQVCFCFFFECSLQYTSSGTAHCSGKCQCNIFAVASSILLHCHQAWNASTLLYRFAEAVAWRFWRYHKYIHIGWRYNLFEMNIEPMGET